MAISIAIIITIIIAIIIALLQLVFIIVPGPDRPPGGRLRAPAMSCPAAQTGPESF